MPLTVSLSRSLLVAGAVTACVAACGGQEFAAGSGDAGSSSGGSDASACVTPPAATGDEADFCAVETKLYTECGECEACRQTDLNNCVALGDDLSKVFKDALDACQDQVKCGDYSTYGSDPCVSTSLANSAKTTTQTAAATAYCTKCATTAGATCGASFFQPPQADGGAYGPGYLVLLSSDAIVTTIASTCAGECGALYEGCALVQFCKTQAADACKTGYCGK